MKYFFYVSSLVNAVISSFFRYQKSDQSSTNTGQNPRNNACHKKGADRYTGNIAVNYKSDAWGNDNRQV